MGKHIDYKQEINNDTYAQAKAEYQFSDRLYEIMLAYQNRYVKPDKKKPLSESERVGELCLELSRLYNQIWTVALGLNRKDSPTKQKQMGVNA